jgi:hypothetical protein
MIRLSNIVQHLIRLNIIIAVLVTIVSVILNVNVAIVVPDIMMAIININIIHTWMERAFAHVPSAISSCLPV